MIAPQDVTDPGSVPAPISERNRTIEGLRGFSAALVICSHLVGMTAKVSLAPPTVAALAPYALTLGHGSVALFFMISGFLIVQSLAKQGNIARFLRNRAIRIYPAFLPLHLLMFLFGPLIGYEWMGALRHDPAQYAAQFLSNLFFLPGMLYVPLAQKNAWSLSYELAFYLLASLFFLAFALRRRFPLAGSFALFPCILLGVACVYYRPQSVFFLCGVLVFVLSPRLAALCLRPWQAETLFLWLLLLYIGFHIGPYYGAIPGFVAFALLVREQGAFPSWLRSPLWQFFGRISYSLYLVHPFPLEALRQAFLKFHLDQQHPTLAFILFVALGAPLAVGAGFALYQLMEVWFTGTYLRTGKRRGAVK